ncbi:protein FAM107B isoform X1 [Seriola aureovittata]|uniref:protein FAM107B isoform X1 n=1 Tax=Seriola aureovittata TaxID=2871759 RepID=UPI0024BDFF73|nr:protein FAM107B isoform X1 [Seriola aureovittata]
MHGLPCSSLGHCFGNPSDVNTDPAPAQEPNNSRRSRNNHGLPAADPVISQPEAPTGSPQEDPQHKRPQRTVSCISTHSTRTRKVNSTNSNFTCHPQDKDDDPCFESPPPCRSLSQTSDDDELELECSPELKLKYPQIPRPSIIIRQPKESEFQETASDRSDCRETEDGGLSDPCDPGLSLSPGRSVMAEPDYLEGDCDELIKPKKLINPVKNSRNHQDLHRELLMNQKRGLAPQNKPELQKVLEKRKREQVLKAQKEEQEAHKKRSDLEIELMKRQQKLEQLELEQQKIEEEQENTPEFVKMKGNLRRTKQETDGEERTT